SGDVPSFPTRRSSDLFRGIAEGTENSNFFVSLEKGEFVLTLVERGAHDELPFVIELLDVLHGANLAVPFALRTRDGDALRRLARSEEHTSELQSRENL